MALGSNYTRNWGKEAQEAALRLIMKRRAVAYEVRNGLLFLAPSRNGTTLPFNTSVASLVNVRRGQWEAQSLWDGRVIARGVSERDVIRATIATVWH